MKTKNSILGEPALTTSQICKLLGFNVSGKFIEEVLEIPPDEKTKTTNLWKCSNFYQICYQIAQHSHCIGQQFIEEAE